MSQPTDAQRRWIALATVVGLEVALVLSWSAGFVGIRFAIDYAPIFLILLWRSLVSGLCDVEVHGGGTVRSTETFIVPVVPDVSQ